VTSLTRRRLLVAPLRSRSFRAFAQTRPLHLRCTHVLRRPKGLFSKQILHPRFRGGSSVQAPRLIVTGQVLSARCQPVANTLLISGTRDETRV